MVPKVPDHTYDREALKLSGLSEVITSKASSSVPKPPDITTKAVEYLF